MTWILILTIASSGRYGAAPVAIDGYVSLEACQQSGALAAKQRNGGTTIEGWICIQKHLR